MHDTFVSVGYIQPIPGGLRIRPFEAAGQTANFIAKKDEQIVAVLGLVVDSPDLGLPSDSSFRQELDVLRARGLKLAEGTNQAVVPSFRKTAVTTELMRCGVAQTMMHDCDAIIVTVSPSHARFYELLDFRRASAVRSYSKTVYDPVVVMYMNTRPGPDEATTDPCLAYTRKFLFTDNPYHGNVHAWQERRRIATSAMPSCCGSCLWPPATCSTLARPLSARPSAVAGRGTVRRGCRQRPCGGTARSGLVRPGKALTIPADHH